MSMGVLETVPQEDTERWLYNMNQKFSSKIAHQTIIDAK